MSAYWFPGMSLEIPMASDCICSFGDRLIVTRFTGMWQFVVSGKLKHDWDVVQIRDVSSVVFTWMNQLLNHKLMPSELGVLILENIQVIPFTDDVRTKAVHRLLQYLRFTSYMEKR